MISYSTSLSQAYRVESLFFEVYVDGKVHVKCVVNVNPELIEAKVSLFGRVFENMLVLNERGLLLNYEIVDGGVGVYSVGSNNFFVRNTLLHS